MAERIETEAASAASPCPVSDSGLSITEIETRGLWSAQANSEHSLSSLARTLFGGKLQFGEMLTQDSLRLLHLWPHKAYLLSDQSILPGTVQPFETMLTDISHGICQFSLSGSLALEFMDSYTTADLSAAQASVARNLRCLLGQYPILLWWDEISDLRIMLDRSYAQSFRDYLEHLMQRRDPGSP